MTIASFGRAAVVVLFGVLAAGAAHAVYRCGNTYQDRPCDDKGPQPHLTPGMNAAPAPRGAAPPSASPFAAACSRLGQEAQKIAWKREGGATQEKQLAELPNTGSRDEMSKVIDSVYRKRGSAPEIRSAVEAECIADKQKEADVAATLKVLQSGPSGTVPAAAPAAATSASRGVQSTSAPTGPSSSCQGWRSEMDSINADFRRGGSAATMERLQNRRRDVEKSMRDGRC